MVAPAWHSCLTKKRSITSDKNKKCISKNSSTIISKLKSPAKNIRR